MKYKYTTSKHVLFIIVCACVTVGAGFMFSDFTQEEIFPKTDKHQYSIDTYREEVTEEWSKSTLDVKDDEVRLAYTLTNITGEPFVAVFLEKKQGTVNILDLGNHKSIKVFLDVKNGTRIPVTIKFDYPPFRSAGKMHSEVPITYIVPYEGPGEYSMSIDDFEIPSWWLRFHGVKREQIDLSALKNVNYLIVGSCQAIKENVHDIIKIKAITFYTNNNQTMLTLSFVFTLLLLGTYVHFLRGRKIIVPIVPIEVEEESTLDVSLKVVKFIAANYSDPNLSIRHVQREFRMSIKGTREVFSKELFATFSDYLRTVRMAEVKRLLTETKLNVSEIAFKCGFNDIPHFNRTFKSITGSSPKEFRGSQ